LEVIIRPPIVEPSPVGVLTLPPQNGVGPFTQSVFASHPTKFCCACIRSTSTAVLDVLVTVKLKI
jgi:hypothetical protein